MYLRSGACRFYCRALFYFRSDLPLILAWIVFIALGIGVGLLAPWPMAILADSVLGQSPPASLDWIHRFFLAPLPESTLGKIVGLAVFGLAIKLFGDLVGIAQTLISNRVNYAGLLRVRCDLFRKLQALSLTFHRSRAQGDTIYRLNSDVYGAQTILGVLVSTLIAVVTLVAMTVVLAQRSASLTLLAFSIAPALAIANVTFGRRFRKRTLECKERDSSLMAVTQQALSCINLVQAFGREEHEFGRFHATSRQTIAAWWKLNREQIVYQLLTSTLFGLGGAAIFGYGGYLVWRGTLTLGDLIVFTGYLGMLWGPLCQLTGFTSSLQGGAASMQRVFEVLDCDLHIVERPHAKALPPAMRTLELHNVHYAYREGDPVLRGLTVRIEPGEMVAFVGSSGVGKSTLLNLLPRFADPSTGTITLDGHDLRDLRLADLRRHVALVLQEAVLLPTNVADNIAYGRPTATREQIIAAAKLAGAHDFIQRLPQGYDSPIHEGGSNLSGGQRQRLAIARALLTEAPFVILDEPTSALDAHHEALVNQTLWSLKGQRTFILVSHRLSTVEQCDRIFVMNAGQIVETGTHQELIAQGGLYARMAEQQLGISRARLAAA